MPRFRRSWIAAAAILAFGAAHAAGERVLKPIAGPLDVGSGFDLDKKTRKSVSGIACTALTAGQFRCLVVFDEGTEARYARISGTAFSVESGSVALSHGDGELDAEAATTDGSWSIVAGSHSVKRKTCTPNPDSRFLARFRVETDPKPGAALRDFTTAPDLWTLMSGMADLGAGRCLGEGGLNIEGMAAKDGRLLLGFRGPSDHGRALILSVDTEALFARRTSDFDPKLMRLDLGSGRGVRDMAAVKDGILILAGPDDDPSNADAGWVLALWDGHSATPAVLGRLALDAVRMRSDVNGCKDKEIKPEALFVRDDAAARYGLVILSDGLCDGGPLLFDVPR